MESSTPSRVLQSGDSNSCRRSDGIGCSTDRLHSQYRHYPSHPSLGGQAHQLAIHNTTQTGASISYEKGCVACCRMVIPAAPPDAFALLSVVEALPSPKKNDRLLERFQAAQKTLHEAGLEDGLRRLSFSEDHDTEEELEPLNRAYYALRIPCPFLEDEMCSIYEQRTSACRELFVTSPAGLS